MSSAVVAAAIPGAPLAGSRHEVGGVGSRPIEAAVRAARLRFTWETAGQCSEAVARHLREFRCLLACPLRLTGSRPATPIAQGAGVTWPRVRHRQEYCSMAKLLYFSFAPICKSAFRMGLAKTTAQDSLLDGPLDDRVDVRSDDFGCRPAFALHRPLVGWRS